MIWGIKGTVKHHEGRVPNIQILALFHVSFPRSYKILV